jgi:hypothetical protein
VILAAAIELWCGGPGSGCHGENCGRHKVVEDLLKHHDSIVEDPRRMNVESVFTGKQRAALEWQGKALKGLMDDITDRVGHPDAREYVRKAASRLDTADEKMAAEQYSAAMLHQEEALMDLHEAIRITDRYPSSIRQVAHA